MLRVGEQPTLCAVGRREPDVRVREAARLAQVFEDRRIQAASVVANTHRLAGPGEDRKRSTVVAEIGRADVGERHAGGRDLRDVGGVGRRAENFLGAHATGECDDDHAFGLVGSGLRPEGSNADAERARREGAILQEGSAVEAWFRVGCHSGLFGEVRATGHSPDRHSSNLSSTDTPAK